MSSLKIPKSKSPATAWLPLFLEFASLVKVTSKEKTQAEPIQFYDAQMRFLAELCEGLDQGKHHFVNLKARQLGMCLHPDTKVLTADLRWIRIDDVHPGQEIVSVDENVGMDGVGKAGKLKSRKMRTGIAEAVSRVRKKAYRLTFDDGRMVICTGEHRWLVKHPGGTTASWISITRPPTAFGKGLPPRNIKVGSEVRWVCKPWGEPSLEDYWFGGMLDGEGSLSKESRCGVNICVSQLPGPVFDRMKRHVEDRKYIHHVEDDQSTRKTKYGRSPVPKIVVSRLSDAFEVIGRSRPTRFLSRRFWEGKELPGKRSGEGWATITAIEELGEMEMIDLQTSTKTFIAEGLVSHNSTIMWLIDIFWLWMHPGLRGAMIFDTGDNRDVARETITEMIGSLPPGWRIPVKKHNRTGLFLSNGSQLQYLAAGRRKTGSGLGRSRAFSFVHASEVAFWGDQAGLDSLIRSLAEENPDRLYVFESTANGFNLFHDMCNEARTSPAQHFMFIGWWAKDIYRLKEGTKEFERWWGEHPQFTAEEQLKCAVVREKYGHNITPEQMAWYRKQSFARGTGITAQELPFTESEAFVATGSSFFSLTRVTKDLEFITQAKLGFQGYSYKLGKVFTETSIEKVEKAADAELKIWEEPRPHGKYAIGVDGAYGRSDSADRSAISIWRCYADKAVQVAEFATPRPEVHQTAWVLAHLAGCYRDCMINVELLGPGELIMAELKHLKSQMAYGQLAAAARELKIANALDNARWFLSHRLDATGVGSYLYNTKTTNDEKARLYGRFRDGYNLETILPRSVGLLGEMTTLVQNGLKIEASGRNKDDRIFSASLAIAAWTEWIRPSMIAQQRTYAREKANEDRLRSTDGQQVINHIVPNHFKRKEAGRREEQLRRLIEGM